MELTGTFEQDEIIAMIGDRITLQSIKMIAESEDMYDEAKIKAILELIKVSSIAKDLP